MKPRLFRSEHVTAVRQEDGSVTVFAAEGVRLDPEEAEALGASLTMWAEERRHPRVDREAALVSANEMCQSRHPKRWKDGRVRRACSSCYLEAVAPTLPDVSAGQAAARAVGAQVGALVSEAQRRLMTEPHDGHGPEESCPGCPHEEPDALVGQVVTLMHPGFTPQPVVVTEARTDKVEVEFTKGRKKGQRIKVDRSEVME